MPTAALSEDEVRLFRHNGLLRLSGQFPPGETAALRAATEDLSGEPDTNKLKPVLGRADVFWRVATAPLLRDPLESLLGPDIEVVTGIHNHIAGNRAAPPGEPQRGTEVRAFPLSLRLSAEWPWCSAAPVSHRRAVVAGHGHGRGLL